MIDQLKSLSSEALASLKDNWGMAIGGFFLLIIVSAISGSIPLAAFIVGGSIQLGMYMFSLNISRGKELQIEQIFDGFKNFKTALIAYLLIIVFAFIGFILFIIPGIIIVLMLSMTFFIIADEPEIPAMDALKKSKEMMEGHKLRLFVLQLWFALLGLLSALTLFIGLLWLIPYMQVTLAKFYEEIKA